jgi:hypothetical protein
VAVYLRWLRDLRFSLGADEALVFSDPPLSSIDDKHVTVNTALLKGLLKCVAKRIKGEDFEKRERRARRLSHLARISRTWNGHLHHRCF